MRHQIRERRTLIPNVSPLGLKINSLCVCNQCWRGHPLRGHRAPGQGSLSILSQQMLFLIRSESQDTLTFPLFPLSQCNVCLILLRPTSSNLHLLFCLISSLKLHKLKYVFLAPQPTRHRFGSSRSSRNANLSFKTTRRVQVLV